MVTSKRNERKMTNDDHTTATKIPLGPVEKIRQKKASLAAQLALLEQEEKIALEQAAKAGTGRLVSAMQKENFGMITKGDATRFSKLLAKIGFARTLEILSKADG
jgi:hypothetical protein